MAYLRLRRLIELSVLDRPALAAIFPPRGEGASAAPAARWDSLYDQGAYDGLLKSEQRHHHRLLAGLVAERAPGGRVLEVGCGEGAFYQSLRLLKPGRYLGTDISTRAIAAANDRFAGDVAAGAAEFRVADGGPQFTADERFDAVIFADCIEYLGPVLETVRRYGALLAPGGVIGVAQWLALHPLGLWREMKTAVEVLDEAVVSAPWGGAWQVWTCRPKASGHG
ncbi:class I SAM-dependent methyltransferase [Phenylobacterium hankyongense]|uniref:Class I SAM-dependent methyltransferase n=1 Tax=Phenylobacterium hankyongense TaxID=1813876 RepID=A0A328B1L9_9CAUL|nr:class I SAM-dependent methyltransferase [Phenylobacterium hankyongense]RAK59744.1 class I SAM-dependent methyltransferase [Phenylobacterium hankyongense]